MTISNYNKNVVVIAGPTAVGKTELTLQLAETLKSVIISADSRQFYKELNIGTAKPEKKELEQVKHYFINNLSIGDYYNVSRFEKEVLDCLEKLFTTSDVVLLTGGSGLYIDAFCAGIDDLPEPDSELRRKLFDIYKTHGIYELRFMLKKYDPEYYDMVDLANPKRIMRALEVCMGTGLKYSQLRTKPSRERHFNIIKIGLERPRAELFERINHRVEIMFEKGLLEEARKLWPHKQLNALNTVGYKELFQYFEKKISFETAKEKIKTNTRRYAKRQMTWFKKDNDFVWFHPDEKEKIINHIKAHAHIEL